MLDEVSDTKENEKLEEAQLMLKSGRINMKILKRRRMSAWHKK